MDVGKTKKSNFLKFKYFIKKITRMSAYLLLICIFLYGVTWVLSYWIIQSHMMDTGDIVSDILGEIPEK